MSQKSEYDIMQDEQLARILKTQEDVWRVFRVMSEFVEGFARLSALGPCVSIFGSARVKPNTPYYRLSKSVAKEFGKAGYGVKIGRAHV